MCKTNRSILVVLLATVLTTGAVNDEIRCTDRKPKVDERSQSTAGGIRLASTPVDRTISSVDPGVLMVSLHNDSNSRIWIDKRLAVGHHINIYVIDRSGHPVRLVYPARTLVLPAKDDFVQLQPGEKLERSLDIDIRMLPDFARQAAEWTFVVKVTIFDSGAQFGISGWKGNLKSYVRLKVEKL